MTRDQIKAELKNYLPAKSSLEAATEELNTVMQQLDGVRAVVSSGMPTGSGEVSDPVADAVCRLEAAAKDLVAAIDKLTNSLKCTEQLIVLANDVYGQSIIRWRWQRGVPFREICGKVHLEHTALFEHYEQAIAEISAKTERAD